MKFSALLFTACVLVSSVGHAYRSSRMEGLSSELCKSIKIDYRQDVATCEADSARTVLRAKVGAQLTQAELQGLGFSTYGAVDLGLVPDADSNTAYFFTRWLINSKRERVGVITVEGWYNTEMEASAKFTVRYNLKGEVVKVSEKSLR